MLSEDDRNLNNLPSVILSDYNKQPPRPHQGLFTNSVSDVLWNIDAGSLIYVPNPELHGNGVFGEIAVLDQDRILMCGGGRFSTFTFQGRALNRIKHLPMRGLPGQMLQLMRSRVGITDVSTADRRKLYRQYYGSFEILGDISQIEIKTTQTRFVPADAAILGALTNMVYDNLAKLDAGDASFTKLLDAAFLDLGADGPILHANINSPGEFQIVSLGKTPRIVKALFALVMVCSAPSLHSAALAGSINLTNSGYLFDVDLADIENDSKLLFDFIKSAGVENLQEIKDKVQAFNARTGGDVDATVIK